MGRSARRRRKKLLEIQKAEESLLSRSAGPQSNQTMQVIPSDRHRVWPGVQERRTGNGEGDFWAKDAVRITSQLGYIPGNAVRITARAKEVPLLQQLGVDAEEPVVLQLYPIAVRDEHTGGKAKRKKKQRKRKRAPTDGKEGNPTSEAGNTDANPQLQPDEEIEDELVVEPFPTLYWLTHPILRTLVSKMELQSMGVQLEKRLSEDAQLLKSIEQANSAYGQERYNLLTPSDVEYIQQRKWEGALDPTRGVAGIKNYASVKCLHAHVAHYLSQGSGSADNVLGKLVMEEIENSCQATLKKSLLSPAKTGARTPENVPQPEK